MVRRFIKLIAVTTIIFLSYFPMVAEEKIVPLESVRIVQEDKESERLADKDEITSSEFIQNTQKSEEIEKLANKEEVTSSKSVHVIVEDKEAEGLSDKNKIIPPKSIRVVQEDEEVKKLVNKKEITSSESVQVIEEDKEREGFSDKDKITPPESIHVVQEDEEVKRLTNKEKLISYKCIHIIHEDEEGKRLTFPSSVFFETVKDEIYLIDSGHSRILIYTFDFFHLYTLDKDDGILAPTCMTVDPEGYIFVGQSSNSRNSRARISVFNPCLKWERDIYFDGFIGAVKFVPKNIALDDEGNIYVAGTSHKGIIVLDKNGKYIESINSERVAVCDVEIDRTGNIYLLSEEWGKVYVYDKNRELIVEFGEKGGGSGKLSRPRGLSVDANRGRVYVVDYMRHTANVYDVKGNYLFEFGGKGWGRGWFQFPTDICVDRKGHVLVADTFNNRVQVMDVK